MRVISGFSRNLRPGRAVTLGVFDGIHRGHVRIFKVLHRLARARGLRASVITFTDHPHGTLDPERRPLRLALDTQRLACLRALEIDEVFLVPFTHRLARMLPETFVRQILVERLGVKQIVVGEDFVFGRDAAGDIPLLRRLGRTAGFGVTTVPFQRRRGCVISSTGIRCLLLSGRVELARERLGWPYTLHGRVIRGEGRGARLGIPTANLRAVHELIPAPGVYAVFARLAGRYWPALCHIGPRPTFRASGPGTIEVHIPGWRKPLYGRCLEVQFMARLRGVRTFADGRALAAQVGRDWLRARRLLAASRGHDDFLPRRAGNRPGGKKNAVKIENFD
jgi:riboflavin kinase/FMN adenylyltransferase